MRGFLYQRAEWKLFLRKPVCYLRKHGLKWMRGPVLNGNVRQRIWQISENRVWYKCNSIKKILRNLYFFLPGFWGSAPRMEAENDCFYWSMILFRFSIFWEKCTDTPGSLLLINWKMFAGKKRSGYRVSEFSVVLSEWFCPFCPVF